MEQLINTILGVLVGVPTYLFGGWSSVLSMLTIILALELFTGILKGYKNHDLDSRKLRYGLLTKLAIFVVIIMANFADRIAGTGSTFTTIAVMYYIGLESVSILENLEQMGVPIPKAITKHFSQMRDKDNEEDDGKTTKAKDQNK